MTRIEPAAAPYDPAIADALGRIMPPGMEPLVLFRTMARNPRVFGRMFAGGLLDKGAIGLRQREIVIDRTTARLGCEYEWGVHIALFAAKIGLGPVEIAATVQEPSGTSCWASDEQALISVVDDLVDRRTIAEATWMAAREHFDEAQMLEVIALVGYYHTISFLCRALDLPLESYGARFPSDA
jgi:alkylhydroperoxidase family enzyme